MDSAGTTWKLSFSVNIGCSHCSSHGLQTEETLFPHCPLLSAQEAGLAAKAGRCRCPHPPDILPRTRKAAGNMQYSWIFLCLDSPMGLEGWVSREQSRSVMCEPVLESSCGLLA